MKDLEKKIEEVASIILAKKNLVVLTGAGISVDSGIPDFRSPGGLWEKFDPMEYAYIDTFKKKPEKVWKMMFEVESLLSKAKPNPGHQALSSLEQMGLLLGIITQNIDGLHTKAGNKNVVEFHGSHTTFECIKCQAEYPRKILEDKLQRREPPRCQCGQILKPKVVLFGEPIPPKAYREAFYLASLAQVMIIAGTSATVAPASEIPFIAQSHQACLVEINLNPTPISHLVDYNLYGSTSIILPLLVEKIKQIKIKVS
jgi:NAD-dependent deacetylase